MKRRYFYVMSCYTYGELRTLSIIHAGGDNWGNYLLYPWQTAATSASQTTANDLKDRIYHLCYEVSY